jgi:hypothetical protein
MSKRNRQRKMKISVPREEIETMMQHYDYSEREAAKD